MRGHVAAGGRGEERERAARAMFMCVSERKRYDTFGAGSRVYV